MGPPGAFPEFPHRPCCHSFWTSAVRSKRQVTGLVGLAINIHLVSPWLLWNGLTDFVICFWWWCDHSRAEWCHSMAKKAFSDFGKSCTHILCVVGKVNTKCTYNKGSMPCHHHSTLMTIARKQQCSTSSLSPSLLLCRLPSPPLSLSPPLSPSSLQYRWFGPRCSPGLWAFHGSLLQHQHFFVHRKRFELDPLSSHL